MSSEIKYTKETRIAQKLLDLGMAKVTYFESCDGNVHRVIFLMNDGSIKKDSIDAPHWKKVNATSISEFKPVIPDEKNRNASVRCGEFAVVEWCTQDEFEELWQRGLFVYE